MRVETLDLQGGRRLGSRLRYLWNIWIMERMSLNFRYHEIRPGEHSEDSVLHLWQVIRKPKIIPSTTD